MLLSLMDDPNRIAVQGTVVWITPEGVQGNRTQGIGVQFTQDETGATARSTIEQILGETLGSVRPTAYDVVAPAGLLRLAWGEGSGLRVRHAPAALAPLPSAEPSARSGTLQRRYEITDVRRFPLPSRFSRIRRGDARRCSTRWPRRGHACALHRREPPRLARRARARRGASESVRDRRRASRRRRTRRSRRSMRWSRWRRAPRSWRSARPGSTTTGSKAISAGSASAFACTSARRCARECRS